MLAIKTDGGPDRNTTYVAVQLAFLALALELGVRHLILMRTAPGQSYVNPVERVMSVLNVAGQGIATARGLCAADTEAVLKNANSMKNTRQALRNADGERAHAPDSHTQQYAAAMQQPIRILENAYSSMTWSGEPITALSSDTAAEQERLLEQLARIDPAFSYNEDAKSDRVKRFPQLCTFLSSHTRSGLYVWQYQSDPPAAQSLPLVQPPEAAVSAVQGSRAATAASDTGVADGACTARGPQRAAPLTADTVREGSLPWLPAPVPQQRLPAAAPSDAPSDQNSKVYAPLSAVLGCDPDYSHVPDLGKGRARPGKASPVPVKATNIRATSECQECRKPRAVLCSSALNLLHKQVPDMEQGYAEQQLDILLCDEPQYVCGAALFPPEHALSEVICADVTLSCSSPVERFLYSVSDSTFTRPRFESALDLWGQCGVEAVDAERCKEQGCDLSQKTAAWTQLPLCVTCDGAGAEAVPCKKRQTKHGAKRAVLEAKRSSGGRGRGRGTGRARGAGKQRRAAQSDSSYVELSSDSDEGMGGADAQSAASTASEQGSGASGRASGGAQRVEARRTRAARSAGRGGRVGDVVRPFAGVGGASASCPGGSSEDEVPMS